MMLPKLIASSLSTNSAQLENQTRETISTVITTMSIKIPCLMLLMIPSCSIVSLKKMNAEIPPLGWNNARQLIMLPIFHTIWVTIPAAEAKIIMIAL